MNGTMMHSPLTLTSIFERAGRLFGKTEIVSRMPDRTLHRYTYADFHRRARALAEALQKAGLARGERVATMMWNHYAHLEAYFGIPVSSGVLHTLNLRLHPKELAYISRHAEDRFLIVDDVLLPLYEQFKADAPFERVFVVSLTERPVPDGYERYEDLLATATGDFGYPDLDENEAAGMCYTTGTTGKPKGVAYSHRAMVLQSMDLGLVDTLAVGQKDTVLPVVPMFHINAWCLPLLCTLVGSKQVLPGPHLDPESLLDLCARERVTFTAGVPSIWLGLLQTLEREPGKYDVLPGMRLGVGGSAAPEGMIRAYDALGLKVEHGWGMTETTAVGTYSKVKHLLEDTLDDDAKYALRAKQGLPLPFVEARIVTDRGEAPWDGTTMGELQVRGPFVAASYHDAPGTEDQWTKDGFFRTGDVATIDPEGYVKLTDRIKDLIKSGGEWISSLDLENALMAHPAVVEAAVIAVPHPKWQERPVAVVVFKEGQSATEDELRDFLAPKFAKWWLPDAFVVRDQIPRTTAGKFQKSRLRDELADWRWD